MPGNYTVTAWIGDHGSAGNTSMSVEARRRILPAPATAAGTVTPYVATVNVRQPEGQPTGEGGTGTPGLDVTFAGSAPKLSGLTVQPASSPLVVYLAGDSTVCDQPAAPYTGWGQLLPTHVWAGAVAALHVNSVGVNLPAEMRTLGSALNVPVIDLTAKTQALVESLGPTASAQLYLRADVDGVKDDTHFSEYGAGQIAGLLVQGVRERNLPLVAYLH